MPPKAVIGHQRAVAVMYDQVEAIHMILTKHCPLRRAEQQSLNKLNDMGPSFPPVLS